MKFNLKDRRHSNTKTQNEPPWKGIQSRSTPYQSKDNGPRTRLVGDNVEIGVYSLNKALALAESLELDLVEISPNAQPPVCKILEYKKFLYEQKKAREGSQSENK